MKSRDYCCCAIPLVNAGIYATLTEQFTLGIVVGVLCMATPSIVGAATPAWAAWILMIISFVGAGLQVLGFIAVAQEKSILFRRYLTLHIMVTLGGFAVSAAWIGMSASRHSVAQTKCQNDFFPTNSTSTGSTATAKEGEIMCNVFPWVDVGLMGALWVLLGIAQFYFYLMVSSYGSGQRRDHAKYDALEDPSHPLSAGIPMADRSDPWSGRASIDSPTGGNQRYAHVRQESTNTILNDKEQRPFDGYSDSRYGGYDEPTYPPQQQRKYSDQQNSNSNAPSYPSNAYTEEPSPTPHYTQDYRQTGSGSDNLNRPAASQAHPGEF